MRRPLLLLGATLLLALLLELLGFLGVSVQFHAVAVAFITSGLPFMASACLGGTLVALAPLRRSRWGLVALALGIALEVVAAMARNKGLSRSALAVGPGLAAASIACVFASAYGVRGAERTERLRAGVLALIMPCGLVVSDGLLALTVLLHPTVYDAVALALESAFGATSGFHVGAWAQSAKWFGSLLEFTYVELPLAYAIVYLLDRKHALKRRDAFADFVVMGLAGYAIYHFCPVVGPRPVFKDWPLTVLVPGAMPYEPAIFSAVEPRNCVPSLHTGWAMLLFWRARSTGRVGTIFGTCFLLGTLLATLGLGQHYIIDLVVGIPFALIVRAAVDGRVSLGDPARKHAIYAGIVFSAVWFGLVRYGGFMAHAQWLTWALSVGSVGLTLTLEARLERRGRAATLAVADAAPPHAAPQPARGSRMHTAALALVFAASGLAGLVYEVVFAKQLSLTFGSTARASTMVLAVYLGGLAIGSGVGAKIAARIAKPLQLYAGAEVGVAIFAGLSPLTMGLIRRAYLMLAANVDPGSSALPPLQFALGALVLLPPTILMGITTPALAASLERRAVPFGSGVALLYGANTCGAALGAFGTGYVLLPELGVRMSTAVAVCLNLLCGLISLQLGKRPEETPVVAIDACAGHEPATARTATLARAPTLMIALLGVSGALALGLEVIYTHLLAVVAGNSAYAFSLMLGCFLVGLGAGSAIARCLARFVPVGAIFVASQLLLGALLFASVRFWNATPSYFAGFQGFGFASTFPAREFVRFVVCGALMMPPALLIGASYVSGVAEAVDRSRGVRASVLVLGRIMIFNTAGNVLGAIVAGFWLLPSLGSSRSLDVLACMSLGVALAWAVVYVGRSAAEVRRHLGLAAVALAPVAGFALRPASLDLVQLSTGSNVYFDRRAAPPVLGHAESMDGGLTTVTGAEDREKHRRVQTLLTNGAFQGDDDADGEMRAQLAFTLVPLLHQVGRGPMLDIGFGTGVTARCARDAGFTPVDVAELSGDVVRMADRYFASVNDHLASDPNVRMHVADGRNFLMLTSRHYDLVTIQISPIWFAGAASFYATEFYEIARAHLTPNGVVQQWVQLHRLSIVDIATVLATARKVFEHVWLYQVGSQGMVIACEHDCSPTDEALARVASNPKLDTALRSFDGGAAQLAKSMLLDPPRVEAFIAAVGAGHPGLDLVANDDLNQLEFATPRANIRPYGASLRENLGTLRNFRDRGELRDDGQK